MKHIREEDDEERSSFSFNFKMVSVQLKRNSVYDDQLWLNEKATPKCLWARTYSNRLSCEET